MDGLMRKMRIFFSVFVNVLWTCVRSTDDDI